MQEQQAHDWPTSLSGETRESETLAPPEWITGPTNRVLKTTSPWNIGKRTCTQARLWCRRSPKSPSPAGCAEGNGENRSVRLRPARDHAPAGLAIRRISNLVPKDIETPMGTPRDTWVMGHRPFQGRLGSGNENPSGRAVKLLRFGTQTERVSPPNNVRNRPAPSITRSHTRNFDEGWRVLSNPEQRGREMIPGARY